MADSGVNETSSAVCRDWDASTVEETIEVAFV